MTVERVIIVEYLQPSMSKDLLCKFPDSSALGFNYTESSIWSPLLPRAARFSSHDEKKFFSSESLRKVKEIRMYYSINNSNKKKKKKMVMNAVPKTRLDFSPEPTTLKKGWNRLLKAAAKKFKLQRRAAIQMPLATI